MHMKKPVVVTYPCNPSVEEVGTGRSLGLLTSQSREISERSCLKDNEVESDRGREIDAQCQLWPPHAYAHTHTYTHRDHLFDSLCC